MKAAGRGRARRTQAVLVLALALAAGAAKADDFPLAPGDTVRLQVAGLEQFSTVASVSNDGSISLPRFGRVRAEGQTIDEVRATLQEMVGSITFRLFDASRLASVLEIAPSDVVLEIERYRDVPVLGLVATPGLVPFTAGMTVRAAIAAAGGIFRPEAGAGLDPSETAIRLAELSRMARTRAETLANIWRLKSSLGENPPAPSAAELGLDPEEADELMALQAQMLATANENQRDALAMFDSVDPLLAKRMQYLEEQQTQQAEALELDRQELARITELKDRGLVHLADRVQEMSRTQYLSEAQFLQTQGEIERLRIQRAQSDGERRKLATDQRQADLAALAEAKHALFELESQIAGTQHALALSATGSVPQATPLSLATEAVVHRGTADDAVELRPGMDGLVQPGDAIEVVITDAAAPTPEALGPASLTRAAP